MAYQIPIKYFNAFWLKKVVGSTDKTSTGDYASTVTTEVKVGGSESSIGTTEGRYVIPTWPGLPWGSKLFKPDSSGQNPDVLMPYPCFPWGGRNWNDYAPVVWNFYDNAQNGAYRVSQGLPPSPTNGGKVALTSTAPGNGSDAYFSVGDIVNVQQTSTTPTNPQYNGQHTILEKPDANTIVLDVSFGGSSPVEGGTVTQGSQDLPSCGGSLVSRNPNEELGKERQWAIEEARIFGGYNNTTLDFGVKAYTVEEDNQQTVRSSSLIYSGIFNSLTGINNTNVFSTANPITKSVDPENGSIQKLYAYDTNLTIFQENKVSKALIDKDAIYSAEGVGTPVSSTKMVIGQIVPYTGEFGISKNPESWAQFGFRQYFTDKYRNAVMRLSRDGLTEISSYGMTDYFRDRFSTIDDKPLRRSLSFKYFDEGLLPEQYINNFLVVNAECGVENIVVGSSMQINNIQVPGLFVTNVQGNLITVSLPWRPDTFNTESYSDIVKNYPVSFISYVYDELLGGFDNHNKNYVLSIKDGVTQPCAAVSEGREVGDNFDYTDQFRTYNTFNTLNFDESINGWVSFYSYNPTVIGSLKNEFYTVDNFDLYQHYQGGQLNHGNFYGTQYKSSIEFIFNPKPSISKNFQTIGYEGSSGWQVEYFVSDSTAALFNTFTGTYYPAQDTVNAIPSLQEGEYTDPNTQMQQHAGFYLKENKYVANLVNASQPFNGEVVFGNSMSGIKGFYTTVKLSTDDSTQLGGVKELYCVSSKFVVSSQ